MKVAAILALAGSAIAAPCVDDADQASVKQTAAGQYCDTDTTLCYAEYAAGGNIVYRIAYPDTATAAPFDLALQIVAPKATGWAGLAWGGAMTNNPLTVAWANGDSVVVSSRFAT